MTKIKFMCTAHDTPLVFDADTVGTCLKVETMPRTGEGVIYNEPTGYVTFAVDGGTFWCPLEDTDACQESWQTVVYLGK